MLELKVLGTPGEWMEFRASGAVPARQVTNMDLHCSIRPDVVRTVQFLEPGAEYTLQGMLTEARWQHKADAQGRLEVSTLIWVDVETG